MTEIPLAPVAAPGQLLAGILSIAADAIISIDANQNITLFNSGAERIFGYSCAEVVGQPLSLLLPERFRAAHAHKVIEFGSGGVAARQMGERAEVFARRKSGQEFPAEASISKLMIGTQQAFAVVLRDVSKRKAAADALRQSEERLRLAAAAGHIGLFEHDHGAGIIYWSPLSCQILGQFPSAITTLEAYLSLIPQSERAGVQLVMEAAFDPANNGHCAVEHRIMQQDGTRRWIAVSSQTVFSDEGASRRALRTIGAIRDVTERRLYLEQLEARVAERTLALREEIQQKEAAQAALVQSQRMEALGQLTGGIAHDSNNLLTVILGNLEMLAEELQDHPALHYLLEAEEAAKMGARLNQRLLTFARKRKLESKVIDLNDHVLAMCDLLRRTLGEGITLTTILAHDLWPARVDPSEVENAILNLAINARDAMPEGGSLRIETQNSIVETSLGQTSKDLAPGDYVKLSVSDTGGGMPPEVLSRVFEPFFTTKEQGKGTGLGLSMLYGFVKQSSGHVAIGSEIGRGTTVDVYLPREVQASTAKSNITKDGRGLQGGTETILLVEDNAQVLNLTAARLKRLGYRVIEAQNGPRALALLDAGHRADLIFSDVVMPGGMTGFDLARVVWQRSPDQRILLTSGFAEDAAVATDAMVAAKKILRKPYTQPELALAIREALDAPVA